MTVTEAITWYLSRQSEISPTDAANADKRARGLEDLKAVVTDIWFFRDWSFKMRTGQSTVSSGGTSAVLPSDWGDIGAFGGVWRNSDHVPLRWRDPSIMREWQVRGVSAGSTPGFFSIYDQNATSPFLPLIQVQQVSADVVLDLLYNATVPTLDESSNVNNLYRIPAAWHETVIKSGLRALAAFEHGDARKRDFAVDPQYMADKMRMSASLGRQSQRQMPPGFFDRR